MWFRKEEVFLQLLSVLSIATATSPAQQNHEPMAATYSPTPTTLDRQTGLVAPRVLTADEGLAVLGAALDSRAHPDFESDCSHLVHGIYERAGFPYPYASSLTLYTRNESFRRVAHPQPGDLVVWPGHVGIAVNPAQRSFFSALRSGPGVDSYDSAYWRERGHPHFLRYVTNGPVTIQVAPSSRKANLKAKADTDSHPPIAWNMNFNAGEETGTQADLATTVISGVQIVNSARPKPEEVADALELAFSEAGEAPRGQDVLKLPRPLIVFDQLSVERVQLQRDRGWAEVRFNGAFAILRERTNSTKRIERQRWLLVRRDRDTWELTLPPEAMYVPSEIAVRVLAHQLASLTEETAGQPITAEEKVELSRLLSVLLEKQPRPGG